MPKNTKKAERDALHKVRRSIRRKNAAKRKAKNPGPKTYASHPHRRTAGVRQHA